MPRVKLQFSQVELKVGPTLTHGMMPLGRKVKRVERGTWKALFEMLMNETKESIVIFSKGKRRQNFQKKKNEIFVDKNVLNVQLIVLHYRKCKDNVYTLSYVYD